MINSVSYIQSLATGTIQRAIHQDNTECVFFSRHTKWLTTPPATLHAIANIAAAKGWNAGRPYPYSHRRFRNGQQYTVLHCTRH